MTGDEGGLERGGVVVGLARIDGLAPSALARAEARLTGEERTRADRCRAESARRQFVAARALLRLMLARQSGEAERLWPLRLETHGKPVLDAPDPAFVFNLSHSESVVACALARAGELGVDVEDVAPGVDHVSVARRMFSAREAAHVAALTGGAQAEAFYAYWTLKEAYVKARGLGLSLDTTAFAFDLADGDAISFKGIEDDAGRWRFRRSAPLPSTRLALAAAAPLHLEGARIEWIDLGAGL